MMVSVFRSMSFELAYIKNVKFSTTKISLNHATDESSIVQSVITEEKLQHNKRHTSN